MCLHSTIVSPSFSSCSQAKEKFDLTAAVKALRWIETVNGQRLGDGFVGDLKTEREVAELLKDGIALCE